MRLRPNEQDVIKQSVLDVFGAEANVFLFGSRVDDNARGGDIDLYIEATDKADLFEKKLEFLSKVKRQIGDQRIDVVFNENPSRPIEQEARKNGVRL